MSDKVEAIDKEREKHIKKHMEEMKKQYDKVNEKLGSLETKMDIMGMVQAEGSCAIQSKLDALLRNPITQDKLVVEKPSGTKVDFVEPQRKKRESTPLARIDNTMVSGGSLKLDKDDRRVSVTFGCTTRCHDLGQYLGNDEQDA